MIERTPTRKHLDRHVKLSPPAKNHNVISSLTFAGKVSRIMVSFRWIIGPIHSSNSLNCCSDILVIFLKSSGSFWVTSLIRVFEKPNVFRRWIHLFVHIRFCFLLCRSFCSYSRSSSIARFNKVNDNLSVLRRISFIFRGFTFFNLRKVRSEDTITDK